MLSSVLEARGVPHVAISELAFGAGLPASHLLNPEDVIFEKGYCYRGYRAFPDYLYKFDLAAKKKILLIRDPRDMVISNYFSLGKSHVVPAAGAVRDELLTLRDEASAAGPDTFCLLDIDNFVSGFARYEHLLGTDIKVYRYEDVIFNKEAWLSDMLTYLEIEASRELIRSVAQENDVIPGEERPERHIRQVYPGNFRKHLKNETIAKLNALLRPILQRYHYDA